MRRATGRRKKGVLVLIPWCGVSGGVLDLGRERKEEGEGGGGGGGGGGGRGPVPCKKNQITR